MSKITEKTPDEGFKMILLIPKDYNGDSSNLTEFLQAADKLGIEVQKDEKIVNILLIRCLVQQRN
ncbi:hypothetical protein [Vibrio parahaemolyticus]|uniref:hypothetical protein n=1 Tax=Vibrio parahaemolyticus TaxID=670 RepID=UPI0015D967D9|nr:hypothetical protein [Vibrio parahaemolyticus]